VRREVLYNILLEFGVLTKVVSLIKICLNETYSKVRIGKHLFDSFLIKNGLRQGDALSPLLFNFALECAIRKLQENLVGLKFNGTHQLLAYADDVNLLGNNIDTIKKNPETLIETSTLFRQNYASLPHAYCHQNFVCLSIVGGRKNNAILCFCYVPHLINRSLLSVRFKISHCFPLNNRP
jgi:hypothetical protein